MRIATATSTLADTRAAASSVLEALLDDLGATPDALFVHYSPHHDGETIAEVLAEGAPSASVHGSSACLGVMSAGGFHAGDARGMGLLGIVDPDGGYGVGAASFEGPVVDAAAAALMKALEDADEPGALPAVVWVTATPGQEEDVLAGIESVIGGDVPIVGGSAADNDVSGQWSIFGGRQMETSGVVVTALFPSRPTMFAFHSGYEPTDHCGVVTARAEGSERSAAQIDGKPAAGVYDAWTDGTLSEPLAGAGSILAETSLHPLGLEVGEVNGVPLYRLAHPEGVTAEGELSFFARIEEGDTLTLMRGTPDSLATRAGRVARSALATHRAAPEQVAGALVIYCAGCMLTIQDRMDEVVDSLNEALGGAPFLGTFTFGEQGRFVDAGNQHGNLMISVLVFSS